MKIGEALLLAEKIEIALESIKELDVGETTEMPAIKFKFAGKSFTWDKKGLTRTK